MEVRTARVFCAGVVVGGSLTGAIWLYTYQVSNVIRFIDLNGIEFYASRRISVQPWWSVFAAVALLLLGAAAAVWLLPERSHLTGRVGSLFSSTAVTERRRLGLGDDD